jgi:transposase
MPHWSANFIAWLEQICSTDRNPGTDGLRISLEELKQQRGRVAEATRLLRFYTAGNATIALLRTIPGIGFVAAITLCTEIMDMNRFPTLDHLCSYVGLVPSCNSSGEKVRDGDITSIGNRHLRYILIEAAWIAVRKDPELLQAFCRDCRRMKKNKAIVKTAKRLLNRIRCVWQTRTPYTCHEQAA